MKGSDNRARSEGTADEPGLRSPSFRDSKSITIMLVECDEEVRVLDVRSALRRAATFNADRIAIRDGTLEVTFGDQWKRALRLANGLLALGLTPGDRVGVLEQNGLQAADFFLAAAAAGLVRVPLYRRNSRSAHIHMLGNTGCRAVIVAEEDAVELQSIAELPPTLEHIIVRDHGYEAWLNSQPDVDPNPQISLDAPYIIRHSAGTSGQPKGIAYTHRAFMNITRDLFYGMPSIDPGDACVHLGPISHGSGHLFLPVWLAGGINMLTPGLKPADVAGLLESGQASYLFAVPTILQDLMRETSDSHNFPALKAIMVSGAPIGPQTALRAHEIFGNTLYQVYGQTESFPVTFMGPAEWFEHGPADPERLTSAGRVMPFAEVEIRDEGNRPVAAGVAGEIALRCDGQMTEIWNEPDLTSERLIDGWVLTGDVGALDSKGYLHILDRVDDMIVSGGFNIWPAELEGVISGLPSVREVAVVGVPHDRWGETPLAIVVVEDGSDLTEEEIARACAEQLGSYKKPGTVSLWSEPLPRSPVGKIQRKVLREPYWTGHDRRVGGL
jgi:acyl-CoA synthetase (AMP-forming)/AMP-acid ligase II